MAPPVAQSRFLNLGSAQKPIYAVAPAHYDRTASWLQHAMNLVEMNTSYRGAELAAAFTALCHAAPHDQLAQPGDPGELFERQVLAIVGWFPRAVSAMSADAQAAQLQVFRDELGERCRNLMAYRRDHAPREVPPPGHADHDAAVVARAEAVTFRDALPRLRRGLVDLPDTAKDEMTKLVDDLDRWTLVFVLSFPAPRGQ